MVRVIGSEVKDARRWRARWRKGDRRAIIAGLVRLGFVAGLGRDGRGDGGVILVRMNASDNSSSELGRRE